MFEDDDDFEIDEEFLGGVYDAEKSAISNELPFDTTLSDPKNCDLQPSPVKRRKSSPSSFPPATSQEAPVQRTSEEAARLLAIGTQRRAHSLGTSSATNHTTANISPSRRGLEFSVRNDTRSDTCRNQSFKPPPPVNRSLSPDNVHESRSPPKSRLHSESFHLNTSRVRQRKFPGPAGLLPERGRSHGQGQRPNFSTLLNTSASDLDEAEEPLSLCSQSTASVLEDGPWVALQSDLHDGGQELLRRYSVAWVKQKAAARQLVGQKVPFLAAVLHSIDCSSPDPCVVLRDSTGEIPGTLHRSVWDSFGGQLVAGSALVLRFVGVLSTGISARRHYLNITSNNIVTIYSSPLCDSSVPDSSRVRKTDVHNWALSQLLQAANSWEEQSQRKKNTVAPPPFFQRGANEFSSSGYARGGASSNPAPRPSLHTLNGTSNAPANSVTSSSNIRLPVQVPSRINTAAPVVPRLSADNSNNHSSSGRLQLNQGTAQGTTLIRGQNVDPLQHQKNRPTAASAATSSASNKFAPKKSIFSHSGPKMQQVSQGITVQESSQSQTSHDLFSEGDDLDISSVLDGIDSESLFGDF